MDTPGTDATASTAAAVDTSCCNPSVPPSSTVARADVCGPAAPDGCGTASRRRFLSGAGAVALAGTAAALAVAVPATGRAKTPRQPLAGAVQRALAEKNGSDNALVPPLAVRVLHRMGFGPARRRKARRAAPPAEQVFGGGFEPDGKLGEDDVGYFQSLGSTDDARLAAYVEEQLYPANIPDPDVDARMAQHAASFATLNQSLATVWSQRECNGFSEYTRPYREVERAAFVRGIFSRRQLQELMTDFWHNHFNVYAGLSEDTYVGFADWDKRIIRGQAFGNFYNMVYASAKHPVMLRYLDNYRNGDGGINENYARELFELHTLGAENYRGLQQPFLVEALDANPYTALNDAELNDPNLASGLAIADPARTIQRYYVDSDVYDAADALSGWRYEDQNSGNSCGTGAFLTDAGDHIGSSKSILGKGATTIGPDLDPELDGRLAIKMAVYHPGTATHIARKLCQRLIADDPPESIVQAAAAEFYLRRKAGDQIRRTLRVILNSDEFKDAALWGSKTKRPFEYIVSALRAGGGNYTFRMDDSTSDSFMGTYGRTTHRLFWWRTPDGYPDTRNHWQGSSTLVQSWRCVDWLTDRDYEDPARRVMRIIDITLENIAGDPTPRQLAAFWCDWIMGYTPAGGWIGGFGTHWSQAPTELGQAALRFMTQDFPQGTIDVESPWPADSVVPRAQLQANSWSHYWHDRVRGLVALILWSPQFMQR